MSAERVQMRPFFVAMAKAKTGIGTSGSHAQ